MFLIWGYLSFRGNCPTNEGSYPLRVIVLKGTYPEGVLVLGSNWQRDSCPTGVISYRVVAPEVVGPRVVVSGVVGPGVVVSGVVGPEPDTHIYQYHGSSQRFI